jgi:glycosyltransferase involved in cell wall biosynthesis
LINDARNESNSVNVSVIVCTRNRADQLRRCLETMGYIRTRRTWELIVVDNGSTDQTELVISNFLAASRTPGRWVKENNKGLGNARNAGLSLARGKIIAFTDDDCYPPPTYIDNVAAVFEDRQELGYVGGRVLLHDPEDFPVSVIESEVPILYRPKEPPGIGGIFGANMAFLRVALEQIGGFDGNLGAGTKYRVEDADAICRVSLEGWWGAFDPSITIRHHHGRKKADVSGLQRANAFARGAYWTKFALRRDSRSLIARQAYWWIAREFKDPRQRWLIALEVRGVFSYLAFWLKSRIYEGLRPHWVKVTRA